jgi:excisionase family DNA binding protein
MDDGLDGVSVYENFPLSCPLVLVTGQTHMATTLGRGGILTIPEIAKYLKVTERTIYKLAAARKIPAFKVGGSWRFSRTSIDNWIEKQSFAGCQPRRKRSGRS